MRFVPPTVEPYLRAAEGGGRRGGSHRRRAVHALVREYTAARRLLTGVGLWAAVVAAVVVATVGTVMVVATSLGREGPLTGVAGALAVAVAGAAGAWAVVRGRALLLAGRRISRAAEAWLTDVPAPRPTLGHGLHALLSALRPEVYPRLVLAALAGFAAVCLGSVAVFALTRVPGGDALDAAGFAVIAAASTLLTVACVVPAVALWRGVGRVQRGLVRDPGALS